MFELITVSPVLHVLPARPCSLRGGAGDGGGGDAVLSLHPAAGPAQVEGKTGDSTKAQVVPETLNHAIIKMSARCSSPARPTTK